MSLFFGQLILIQKKTNVKKLVDTLSMIEYRIQNSKTINDTFEIHVEDRTNSLMLTKKKT